MKKLFAILLTAVFVIALSACGGTNSGGTNNGMQRSGDNSSPMQSARNNPNITSDEALDIALKQAGVTRDSVRDLENRLDLENGVLVYEIDFTSGNTEYSYDVDANTGIIVDRDRDRND